MLKKIKIIIDIFMYILFVILMCYQITSNFIHELLGVSLFILFILHNIINIKYYKTIVNGKYNKKRLFLLIINILLFLTMIGMMISAVMVSNNIFSFLGINRMNISDKLHRFFTSWGFIIMSIHLGLNMNVIFDKIFKKIKKSNFELIIYIILVLVIIFGIYSFINLRYYYDLFSIGHFKYIGETDKIIYMLKTISISFMICMLNYFGNKKIK